MSDLILKQTKINELENYSQSVEAQYQEVKQKVRTYKYINT